ncbi:MAG: nucleotidyltransferase domain-containing protein [Thermodesulfobacteriota bacterium]|nr:nucleotidyltransferase domain-containing protein [Thermodesulfobacteriota bacterium]
MDRILNSLEEARKIILKGLKGYRVKVLLFGSRATGQSSRTSDIDVAIYPREPLPHGLLSTIRQELAESKIPYSVDLVDMSQLGPAWLERIQMDGILWKD